MFIERLLCLRTHIRQLSLEFTDQCFVKSKTLLKTTRSDPANSASASDTDPSAACHNQRVVRDSSLSPATRLRGVIETWESEGSIE